MVHCSVLGSSSTPCRDSCGWLAQKQAIEDLFSWAMKSLHTTSEFPGNMLLAKGLPPRATYSRAVAAFGCRAEILLGGISSRRATCFSSTEVLRRLWWMQQSSVGTDDLQEFCLILFFLFCLGFFFLLLFELLKI